jgi:hypothetical protein
VLSKTDASGSWTYAWDFENRLKQAGRIGGVTVSYNYDALGRRVQRSGTVSGTTKFVYDGLDVIRDLDANGSTVVDYLNGRGMDQNLRQTQSSNVSYFLADHLGGLARQGSPRALRGPVIDDLLAATPLEHISHWLEEILDKFHRCM